MFELRIILNKNEKLKNLNLSNEMIISQNILSRKDSFEKYETLNGEIKMFQTKYENISLTEKYEFFRYLPINRTKIIFVISIPYNLTIQDFYVFIDKHLKTISYIRFFYKIFNNKDTSSYILQAIIYFESQNSADYFFSVNLLSLYLLPALIIAGIFSGPCLILSK